MIGYFKQRQMDQTYMNTSLQKDRYLMWVVQRNKLDMLWRILIKVQNTVNYQIPLIKKKNIMQAICY
jgi:hypothetical protein